MHSPISLQLNKYQAFSAVLTMFGSQSGVPAGSSVDEALDRIVTAGHQTNPQSTNLTFLPDDRMIEKTIFHAMDRRLPSPRHLNGHPDCFPVEGVENAYTPMLQTLSLRGGRAVERWWDVGCSGR